MKCLPMLLLLSMLLLPLVFGNTVCAQVITFETQPNGATPGDDDLLTVPYNFTGGSVRMFFDINGNNKFDGLDVLPAFEQAGRDSINAFASAFNGVSDVPRPGYEAQLGNFFLRVPGSGSPATLPPMPPGPFIAQYTSTTAIAAFSGELWDLDGNAQGTEQWRIDVLSSVGAVLATLTSPLGSAEGVDSLDSLPWVFAFNNLPTGVDSIRVTFIGSKTNGAGFAFNNFSPTFAVPEPSGMVLIGIAALALVGLKLRSGRETRGEERVQEKIHPWHTGCLKRA